MCRIITQRAYSLGPELVKILGFYIKLGPWTDNIRYGFKTNCSQITSLLVFELDKMGHICNIINCSRLNKNFCVRIWADSSTRVRKHVQRTLRNVLSSMVSAFKFTNKPPLILHLSYVWGYSYIASGIIISVS